MQVGEVVGTVVATRKEPSLEGLKFLVVREVDAFDRPTGRSVICVDVVGAGLGDRVLYAQGSSARQTEATRDRPADAVVMAIVEEWDVDGKWIYRRQAPVEAGGRGA